MNRELGWYPRAEALFQEALAIRERVYGPAGGDGWGLTDLGELYGSGLYTDQGSAPSTRAREIRERCSAPITAKRQKA